MPSDYDGYWKDETMFEGCESLSYIITPQSVSGSIALPQKENFCWIMPGDIEIKDITKKCESMSIRRILNIPKDVIASGETGEEYGQIIWYIDNEHKLVVKGKGNVQSGLPNEQCIPWHEFASEIVTAEIKIREMTDLSYFFNRCSQLKTITIDTEGFAINNVTNMSHMFSGCSSLEELNLFEYSAYGVFDTGNVSDMSYMFSGCEGLDFVDFTTFDTENVTNMSHMFSECESIEFLDLSNFDTRNVTTMEDMFFGCDRLMTIEIPSRTGEVVPILPNDADFGWFLPNGRVIKCFPINSVESVTIQKQPKPQITVVFSDVYQDWYTDYVKYVYENGLMTGIKGTERFEPETNITKAQVAQVLYNMDNAQKVENQEVFTVLNDVYEGEWYANAVAWAYNNNIVTGDTNAKKFFPNADVTREQLSIMMYRYAKYKGMDTSATSNLAGLKNAENVSNWALDGVKWAVGSGLIRGIETNGVKDLAPQGNATRAQMAAILQRF
jgi:surface protein